MPNRIEYFDILRGLAILGVVAGHSSNTGLNFAENSLNFNFTVLWRNLLTFSVPMFLAISGYFLAKKPINNANNYFVFLKYQIPRVYIPLLFWSFFWFIFLVLIKNKPILSELIRLLCFQSSSPYYFIALIIQYYILLPFFKSFANTTGLLISIVASITMTGIIFYFRYYTDIRLPLIVYAGNFLTWLMFFVLGLYLGSSIKIKISNKILIVLILVLYALSCLESYFLINKFHQAADAASGVKPSSFIYSFFLIIFLFKNHNLIQSTLLKRLGEISFGIYLIHTFLLMVTSQLLLKLYAPLEDNTIAYQLALIFMVTVSCFVCISIFNRTFSSKQSQLIGFK